MLEAMWMFVQRPGLRICERVGPFKTHAERRQAIEDRWRCEPTATIFQVDVYDHFDVHMTEAPREVA
jgi:hypothetical protein